MRWLQSSACRISCWAGGGRVGGLDNRTALAPSLVPSRRPSYQLNCCERGGEWGGSCWKKGASLRSRRGRPQGSVVKMYDTRRPSLFQVPLLPQRPQTCLPFPVCLVVNPPPPPQSMRALECFKKASSPWLCEYDSGALLRQDKFNVTLQLMSL